jgi:alkylhydroperoxidase family enzyme
MNPNDAHVAQEMEPRFYGLDAWRDAPYYTDRERAALEWAEALVTYEHVPYDVYERARQQFSEKELVELGMIAVSLDGWHRLAVAFRSEAGTDQPKQQHEQARA